MVSVISILITGLYYNYVFCLSELCSNSCKCSAKLMNCSDLQLTGIPRNLPQGLKILILDRNHINSLAAVNVLPELSSLDLSHNKITGIHNTFWNSFPSLETVNLSHNYLLNISEEMFPESAPFISLNLNNNRISVISNGSFDCLKRLSDLKLSRNSISSLSKELFKNMGSLKSLELNRNLLTIIEGLTFKGLQKLITLKLRQNAIHNLLDGAFYGLHNLRTLRLDSNNITLVSKRWVYGLNSLQELHLSNNKVSEIEEETWEACSHLIFLDLSHNQLQEVRTATFSHLSKLEKLKLDHNKIMSLSEGAFDSVPSLIFLDLSNNHISWIIEDMSGAFIGLKQLLNLSLAANEVTSVNHKAFAGLESLIILDLRGNEIKAIQENAFSGMALKDLLINTSSLLCDCALAWLPSWLLMTTIQLPQAYCGYPEGLKGTTLIEIPATEFQCSENDRPKPFITEVPKSVVSISGSQVNLQCSASSSSNTTLNFKWRRNNDDIDPSKSIVKNNTSILHFSTVSLSNAGIYQCIVSNNFGTAYSHKANLTVLVLPTLTKKPGNVTVRVGYPAKLECAADGEPPPQVGWQKDGGTEFPAAQERRMHVMPTDDAFFIINTKPVDSGLYSCIARNSAGTVTANATLTVLEAPSFEKKMENREVGIGKSVVLECLAKGWPKPKLKWWKDGVKIEKSQRYIFTEDDQYLIIKDTKSSDAGYYQCEITNTLGTEKGVSQLTVIPDYGASHEELTGVIIITVGCCAVGTSAIWVIIIYHTRKRLRNNSNHPKVIISKNGPLDTKSEHSTSSKDSGTGDSTRRSHEDLRISTNGCILNLVNEEEGGSSREAQMPLLQSSVTCKATPECTGHVQSNVKPSSSVRECTRSNHDRCSRPCSTPLNKSSLSLTNMSHPNSYLCLYVPPKPAQV